MRIERVVYVYPVGPREDGRDQTAEPDSFSRGEFIPRFPATENEPSQGPLTEITVNLQTHLRYPTLEDLFLLGWLLFSFFYLLLPREAFVGSS